MIYFLLKNSKFVKIKTTSPKLGKIYVWNKINEVYTANITQSTDGIA